MLADATTLTAWSYAFAGLAFTALALHLAASGRLRELRAGAGRWLFAAVLLTAAWGWLGLADQFARITLFLRLGAVADVLRYGCWFVFLLSSLRLRRGAGRASALRWLLPVSLAAVAGALVVQGLVAFHAAPLNEASPPVLMAGMVLAVLALLLVEQLFRNLQEDSRWSVKPLCLGLAGTFLFDLYLYSTSILFGGLDTDALQVRGAAHALTAPLLLLSSVRSSGYLIFISAVGYYVRYFGGEWGRALQVALVFVGLVALGTLAFSGALRARMRVFLGKHFFRYRFDYREEWLRFTRVLAVQGSPQQMGQQVVHGLADMLDSPAGALWLKGGDGVYRQAARWNQAESAAVEGAQTSLCGFLARTGWVINLDEYRAAPRRYEGLALPEWLLALPQAWLVVPLSTGDDLTGFVVLASARARSEVNWEVNDLLKTAGRQAASYLAQMLATEALLEARKFEAFNRMSAFVVHDLKNIVTQLSLMLKNAKRLHANPEFQQDMLMTIENSLDKMRQLMLQLREGATPAGSAVGVDLGAIAQRIAAGVAQRGRRLEVDAAERAVFTRGHEERLERVLGHLVQNALDATDAAGRVWLKVDRLVGQARVVVGDTGCGMTPEFVRERLFKPFQSTKKAGMGIGAFESFQYVQELGGQVQVHSTPGQGTEVTLLLPVFELHHEAGLPLAEAS